MIEQVIQAIFPGKRTNILPDHPLSPTQSLPSHPSWMWMLRHPLRLLAFGFGAGLSRIAPGTCGTLVGWGLFVLLDRYLTDTVWVYVLLLSFVSGVLICQKASRDLGVQDHGGIVWDEIVAIWLVLFFLPREGLWQAWGFLFFRLFDILKPPPIRYFDQHWHGGLGVMWDDLLAAAYALLSLALCQRFGLIGWAGG